MLEVLATVYLCSVASAAPQHGLTVSVAGGIAAPDQRSSLRPAPALVPRLGYTVHRRWTVEFDVGLMTGGDTRLDGYDEWRAQSPRGNLLVSLVPDAGIQPFFAVGAGAWNESRFAPGETSFAEAETDTDFVINMGYGTFFRVVGPMVARIDLRGLVTLGQEPTSTNQPDSFLHWELTAGLAYRGSELRRDRDFDGVYDRIDSCPDISEDLDGWADADGCPDLDDDNDGVADGTDKCPKEAEDPDGWQDDDGCPEADNDGDGLTDDVDPCPNVAEDMDGWKDTDGCPELDNDDDGVVDTNDQCPQDAEDIDGFEDEDGCPDRDNDGDGVADYRDACPDQREDSTDWRSADGCPSRGVEVIAQDKVRIQADPELARFTGVIDGIHFETGSAVIALDSYTVLKDAASVLLAYPAVRVEVAGHTDAEGPSEPNRLLSEQRAQAVVEYLIGEGVPRTRLSAIGYGETRPLRPNDTAEGRALNRRVEFRIIDGGTGAGR